MNPYLSRAHGTLSLCLISRKYQDKRETVRFAPKIAA